MIKLEDERQFGASTWL